MSFLRLSHLLIALLFFQTAVAFYDSHEELQDIATHVPPHHLDLQDADDALADVSQDVVKVKFKDSGGVDFCHHCCHCHGGGVNGLPVQLVQLTPFGTRILRDSIKNPVLPGIFSALYRPPIAQV